MKRLMKAQSTKYFISRNYFIKYIYKSKNLKYFKTVFGELVKLEYK